MKKQTSRLENSRDVRRVLNRMGVDLTYCQYTCIGMEVRLTGWLMKFSGDDFTAEQVEGMIQDFTRTLKGFTIVGECENWSFNSDHIRYLGHDNLTRQERADMEFDDAYDEPA